MEDKKKTRFVLVEGVNHEKRKEIADRLASALKAKVMRADGASGDDAYYYLLRLCENEDCVVFDGGAIAQDCESPSPEFKASEILHFLNRMDEIVFVHDEPHREIELANVSVNTGYVIWSCTLYRFWPKDKYYEIYPSSDTEKIIRRIIRKEGRI